MEATAVKPSTNGVIRIARRGRVKFEFEDEKPFEVDIVEVNDAINEADWSFRDEEGKLPRDKWKDHGIAMQNLVQAIVNDAYALAGFGVAPVLTRGETEAFITHTNQEVKKLRDFFSPKKETLSSLPTSTEAGTETRFSQ